MENKVLIKVILPEIEICYDAFIPVNELIWKVKKMVVKAVSDLSGLNLNEKEYIVINKDNGYIYGNNQIIIDTDIRNNTELYLISIKK